MDKRSEYFVQVAVISLLVAGCILVLWPFLAAILLAAVICISTWPLHLRLLNRMKGRKNLAALTMTLSLVLVIILPLALVAYNLADNVAALYETLKQSLEGGTLEPPGWLKKIPIVGTAMDEYWHRVASSRDEMIELAKRLLEPGRKFLLEGGMLLGQGVMQMSLAAFVSFFFYRDGEALAGLITRIMNRVIGIQTESILGIINNTVRGVMYGLLGTALAQGLIATIGFAIAGVPAALLLGVATAVVSLIPIGPPLIWGGAAIWLFFQGTAGWGVFMLLWGFFLISSVDNVVKPLLISRGSNLSFILGFFGVLGGLFVFGFVGVFIGPTLLAVGVNLMQEWTADDNMS